MHQMNCSCGSFLTGAPVDLLHHQIHQETDSATVAVVLLVMQERLGMVEFGNPDYETDCLSQTGRHLASSLLLQKTNC